MLLKKHEICVKNNFRFLLIELNLHNYNWIRCKHVFINLLNDKKATFIIFSHIKI